MAELIPQNQQARITVDQSFKINLGNYQTMDIHIGIEDSPRNGENVNQAFERVYTFVQQKLVEKVAESEQALK